MKASLHLACCAAAVATAAAAGAGVAAGPAPAAQDERPALPDPFTVKVGAGQRFTGAAARIDIKYPDAAGAPQVELAFSATDRSGRTWTARAVAPPAFARTRQLTARITDRPLRPGDASVQRRTAVADDAVFARTGSLQLSLQSGRLAGEARGAGPMFPAKFEGPVVVSCAVPASAMAASLPAPVSADAPVALVVDEAFESALCQPYAAWASR
ncbi:MAG TPA: hypothetical protein VLA16_24870, partial [Ideonella sp.]|nr:hypothetical protein [Ideonella sp.]